MLPSGSIASPRGPLSMVSGPVILRMGATSPLAVRAKMEIALAVVSDTAREPSKREAMP